MQTLAQIASILEKLAPLAYQESYDNSGILIGEPQTPIYGVLTTLDVTMEVLQEAKQSGANLVVAHHPLIFGGIKRLTGKSQTEKMVIEAIKSDICIYALHTPLDRVHGGINTILAEKLGLLHLKTLAPERGRLKKLTVFVPKEYAHRVLDALAEAGAGQIGNYSHCSFMLQGEGCFKPNDKAKPFLGQAGELEKVEESRIEVVFPAHQERGVLLAMQQSHPYEEVAYFVHTLDNEHQEIGFGMLGDLPEPMEGERFLAYCAKQLNTKVIRHTALKPQIGRVAVCGGSGASLLPFALAQKADVFLTADFKYHQFFEAEGKIMIADIGHYETEHFAAELLERYLKSHVDVPVFPTQICTNPVHYFVA